MTLALAQVVRHYRSEGETVAAVDGADLTVARGELVALYGPSGSGKSTLLNLAAALDRPDAGTVTFEGARVDRFTADEAAVWRRTITGVVLQTPLMLNGCDVRDNAALSLLAAHVRPRDARARAAVWLERVGIARSLHGRRPHQLSGGERQRVMIARALAIEPALLLADEPTGSLDSARGRAVLELLHEIAVSHHVAVLLVTHDPAAAAVADRCLDMVDGRVRSRVGSDPLLAREPA